MENGLDFGGARQERSQQAVVRVLQQRFHDGSCDLSSDSGRREKVSCLHHLESRMVLNGFKWLQEVKENVLKNDFQVMCLPEVA